MKRRITNLEKTLIACGWHLTLKRYIGKNSETTLCYEYHKKDEISGYRQVVELDKKREKVINFYIANIHIETLDKDKVNALHDCFFNLRTFVADLGDLLPIDERLLESEE